VLPQREEMWHSLEFCHVTIGQKFASVADDLALRAGDRASAPQAHRALLTQLA